MLMGRLLTAHCVCTVNIQRKNYSMSDCSACAHAHSCTITYAYTPIPNYWSRVFHQWRLSAPCILLGLAKCWAFEVFHNSVRCFVQDLSATSHSVLYVHTLYLPNVPSATFLVHQ